MISRKERSRSQWAESSTVNGCAGIHVGDWVLLKHGSDAHAKIRRKHGYPAYRRFRVVRIMPESNSIEIDPRKVNIQPVVSVRQCKRAPEGWYIFNDGSLSSGRYDGPLTLAGARGDPHEIGGRLEDQDEDDPDTHLDHCIYPVEWILEAFHSKRKWYYRVLWLGYPLATWESHEDLEAHAGAEVLKWMAEARKRFQAKFHRKSSNTPDDDPAPDTSILGADVPSDEDESTPWDLPLDPFETNDAEHDEEHEPQCSDLPPRVIRDLEIDCTTEPVQVDSKRAQRRLRRATQLMLGPSLLGQFNTSPLEQIKFLFSPF